MRLSLSSLGFRLACLPLLALWGSTHALADDHKAGLRVMRDECLSCHKPGKAKGGLLLHTPDKLQAGGDSGAAVVKGNAEESLLYQVLLEEGDPHMPPKKQLAPQQITALKQWINAGTPWDESVFDEAPTPQKRQVGPLPKSYQAVLAMVPSPDGKILAVARADSILLLDLTNPAHPEVGRLTGHDTPVQSVAWTPDGRQLISGSYQNLLRWEMTSRTLVGPIKGPLLGNLTALTVDEKGDSLYAADAETGGSGFLHDFDLKSGAHRATWKAHDDTIYALQTSPDNASLLTGSADKLVKLWNRETRKLVSLYEGHTNHVLAVDFNKDGSQLASAGADREIKIWDVKSKEQVISLGNKKNAYAALDWTPDGAALAVVTSKGGGNVYSDFKVHEGTQRSGGAKDIPLEFVNNTLTCVSLSADTKVAFAGGFDGRIHIWSATTGKVVSLPPAP